MPAVADILTAVQAAIGGLYPGVPNRVRKGRPGPMPESPLAGWTVADPCPCFVISWQDPEEIDGLASFETISVRYAITAAYVWPNLAGTGVRDPNAMVEAIRPVIRDALYKPTLAGAPAVYDIDAKSRDPYKPEAGGSPAVMVSALDFTFLVNEPRGF